MNLADTRGNKNLLGVSKMMYQGPADEYHLQNKIKKKEKNIRFIFLCKIE